MAMVISQVTPNNFLVGEPRKDRGHPKPGGWTHVPQRRHNNSFVAQDCQHDGVLRIRPPAATRVGTVRSRFASTGVFLPINLRCFMTSPGWERTREVEMVSHSNLWVSRHTLFIQECEISVVVLANFWSEIQQTDTSTNHQKADIDNVHEVSESAAHAFVDDSEEVSTRSRVAIAG